MESTIHTTQVNIPVKQIHRHEGQTHACQGEGGGGGWIGNLKLGDVVWINNKVLLYSRGNCIQYSLMNHNRKEDEKEYIYMCVTEGQGSPVGYSPWGHKESDMT